MKKDEKIRRLKEQNKLLIAQIDRMQKQDGPKCPLCGAGLTTNSVYQNMHCKQTFGHCGIWWISDIDRQRPYRAHNPKSHFRRTTIKFGRLMKLGLRYDSFRIVHFIAGEEVSEDEYFHSMETIN